MKKIIQMVCVGLLMKAAAYGQTEKEVVSKITNATVYTKGVQLESEAKVELEKGNWVLLFKNLSPYINENSIRVDGDGKFIIQNVRNYKDYLNELTLEKELTELENTIKNYQQKVEDETTWIAILKEKIDFLKANKNVGGKEQNLSPEAFKSLNQIYAEGIEKNTLEVLKKERLVKEYEKEIGKLKNQQRTLNSKGALPSGVIAVTIDSKQTQISNLKLTYMVENASWFPSYDIRFSNTKQPLTVMMKANIQQNTGVDWKNVGLKVSSIKNISSLILPILEVNNLAYNPVDVVKFVSPNVAMAEEISSVYDTKSRLIGNQRIKGKVADGSSLQEDVIETNKESNEVMILETNLGGLDSFKEYQINGNHQINSDSKLNTIGFEEVSLEASYEYYTVPKMSNNVYLVGKIKNWDVNKMFNGAANIYFENAFVGSTDIDVMQFEEDLEVSFGIDNGVFSQREQVKSFTSKQFLGKNKKETKAFKITVKNNKQQSIKLKVKDQVPISTQKEIKIEVLELTGGVKDEGTGEVEWSLELNPGEIKELFIKYEVESPKEYNL